MCAETAPGQWVSLHLRQWQGVLAAECTISISFQGSLLDVSFGLTSRNFLDQRRNSWIPFNLYRLAAGWKSIEISILCQANKSSKRRDQKFERASGELNITDCVDQIKFYLRLSVRKASSISKQVNFKCKLVFLFSKNQPRHLKSKPRNLKRKCVFPKINRGI